MQKIVVVAPHPDDETLGVGGTLLRHREQGDSVSWLIMTHTQGSSIFPEAFTKEREKQIQQVSKRYGFQETIQLPFQAACLDTHPLGDVVQEVRKVFQRLQPHVLYVPSRFDIHSDHQVTFDAVMASAKTFRMPSLSKTLVYETPSETDFSSTGTFSPNMYVNIEPYLAEKMSILEIYASEIAEHPFPRSREGLKALATVRGAAAFMPYAESFMLLKEIQR